MKLNLNYTLTLILGMGIFSENLIANENNKSTYANSYVIVTSQETLNSKEWNEVIESLQNKHKKAKVITYKAENGVNSVLTELKNQFPKYVCFVMTPDEVKYKNVVSVHRMMRQWDDDIYSDAIYSFVTGPDAISAKRIASATEPKIINSALITSSIGTERYREAYIISDSQPGEFGIKTATDRSAKMQVKRQDMTSFFIEGWNKMDPDLILTSSHASQRNLEMPFSYGNIVCYQGKLYGRPNTRMIDYSTGQAKESANGKGHLEMNLPKKPKVVFCVGNCLIGDIPDLNCMALAFMGYGNANQYIGYSTTTWFGMAGWTTLKLWEQNAGIMPLNEAYYFSNQNLLRSLSLLCSNAQDFNPKYETSNIDREFNHLLQNFPGRLTHQLNREEFFQLKGMLWDRDAVIMYGDPAFETRLNQENLPKEFLPSRQYSLQKENNQYILTITANSDCLAANQDTAPGCYYFDTRLTDIKIIDAAEMTPVITDNFIMIKDLKAMKKGEKVQIRFSANIIE